MHHPLEDGEKKKIVRYCKSNAKSNSNNALYLGHYSIVMAFKFSVNVWHLTPPQPTWTTKELKILKRERERK